MLLIQRSETDVIDLILSVAKLPYESPAQCVERLIDEDMLVNFEDRERFRLYVGIVQVNSYAARKSFEPLHR